MRIIYRGVSLVVLKKWSYTDQCSSIQFHTGSRVTALSFSNVSHDYNQRGIQRNELKPWIDHSSILVVEVCRLYQLPVTENTQNKCSDGIPP